MHLEHNSFPAKNAHLSEIHTVSHLFSCLHGHVAYSITSASYTEMRSVMRKTFYRKMSLTLGTYPIQMKMKKLMTSTGGELNLNATILCVIYVNTGEETHKHFNFVN